MEVDPEAAVALEMRRLDNGWRAEADARPARGIASRFLWFVQALFSALLAPV